MGKKAAAPASTVTQNTSNIPEYARPYFEELLGKARTVSEQPYQSYDYQRLASINPELQAGRDAAVELGSSGTPEELDIASQRAEQGANIQGGQFGSEQFGDAQAKQYMNPYLNNVLDTQYNKMFQQFQEQQGGRDSAAAKAGAFGGSRATVANQIALGNMNSQAQEMTAKELYKSYSDAQQQFERDQQRKFGAEKATDQSRLDAEKLGLASADMLRQLGLSKYDVANRNVALLKGTGQEIKDDEQQELDLAYKDFLAQREYDKEQVGFYSDILRGLKVTPNTNSEITTQSPSQISQMLGLGLGALGTAKGGGT